MKLFKYILICTLFFLYSCDDQSKYIEKSKTIYSILKFEYAPDESTEIFDIDFIINNDNELILEGVSTTKIPFYKLTNSLSNNSVKYTNNVRFLPDSAVGNEMFGLVKNPVINHYSKPEKTELLSQTFLGTPIRILDKKGSFLRIQTPNKYISWVDENEIIKMDIFDFETWIDAEKIIYTKNLGNIYADKKFEKIVSEITLGATLKLIDIYNEFYEVEYPDLRKGYIKINEATLYNSWIQNLATNDLMKRRQPNIEETAKSMQDIPYLLGGNSTKGLDANGFTKMVYLMNGFIIPTEISQQFNAGKIVDANLDFSGLQKGDLLFFGTKATEENKQKVTHVGLWLGNDKMEFIHSFDDVHISSMSKNQSNYDEVHQESYLGSRRYLSKKDKNIIDLKEDKIITKKLKKYNPLYPNKYY